MIPEPSTNVMFKYSLTYVAASPRLPQLSACATTGTIAFSNKFSQVLFNSTWSQTLKKRFNVLKVLTIVLLDRNTLSFNFCKHRLL